MSPFDPKIDATFREYADLELRCHHLLLEGMENAPETVEAESRMEELWENLDETQRRSLSGMGSDLNWVRRKGEPPPNGRKNPEEVTSTERQELMAAMGSKDWHKALHYLRICAPIFPIITLAQGRGKAYDALGFPSYASIFYEQGFEIEPNNADLGIAALSTIQRTDPGNALQHARTIIASPMRYPPVIVAFAAVLIMQWDEIEKRAIDHNGFSALLSDTIKRSQLEPSDEARMRTYEIAAFGFKILKDMSAVLRCIDEALKLSPYNDRLLVDKGLLLYDSQTDQAIDLFSKLTQIGTQSVWPYFFMAHHYLLRRNYNASLEMGREAWTRQAVNPIRALLLEWQAICLAELNYPSEMVRPVFVKAASLDPSNPWIAKNLAAFDEARAKATGSEWHIEEAFRLKMQQAESVRVLNLAAAP
jgi:tetratricopeptide (TPR) repeat protein